MVVGTVRNCELTLEKNIALFRDLFTYFDETHFFIVESDSSDETILELKKIEDKYENFKFISLGQLEKRYPSRTERIALCRNYYLDEIRMSNEGRKADYICVVDLDGDFSQLSTLGILSCWKRDGWDACFANQNAPYYDIWALRHPYWSPNDCWKQQELLIQQGMNRLRAKNLAVYSKMVRIRKETDWIEVQSAFGGLGIYKRNSLVSGEYLGKDEKGNEVCEHVSLNSSLHENGGKLFINPKMVTGGWNTHNAPLKTGERLKTFIKLILLDFKKIL